MKDVLSYLQTSCLVFFILAMISFFMSLYNQQYLPFYSFLIITTIYGVGAHLVKEMRRLHGEG